MISLSVGSSEFDTVAKYITNTYPNACIMSIDKIQDPPYLDEYEELKRKMAEPNEKTLFHGTSAGCANEIVKGGYDPEKNVTSAYGHGTYFASTASMSSGYMKNTQEGGFTLSYMLVNTVLVGTPVLFNGSRAVRKNDTDVVVNSLANPSIFVVVRPAVGIPRYLVSFYTGATAAENAAEAADARAAKIRKPRKARGAAAAAVAPTV